MNLNWTIAKIEEIAEVNPRLGKADIPDDLLVSFVPMPAVGAGVGSIDVSQVRPFGEVKKGFTSFQQGDVLFAKITPCMENGKMAVVPKVENGYGFGSTEFHVLRPKSGIDARYLYYYVSSRRFRGEAEHQMTGAVGQKRVPTQFLRECTIPLAPHNEQTRIVAEIEKQFSRLDEAVANLKRVKANLKRYKAAVLKAAVEGKLTEEWRRGTACRAYDVQEDADQGEIKGKNLGTARRAPTETGAELLQRILAERRKAAGKGKYKGKYKEPVGPDTSGLPELPAGWVWASLDQITSDSLIGLDRGRDQQNADGVGVPYVKMNNVTMDGQVLLDDLVYVQASKVEIERFALERDDVLFNTRNSKELVGKVGLVRQALADGIYNNNLMRLRFAKGIVPSFVSSQMCSDGFRKRMELVKKATTNVAAVYAKDLFPLQVALPPLAEQHQIVAEVERRLSIVAGAEAQVDANLRRADRLRQSILKQAFSGQLVPQDESDEPAGVLLERIRNNNDLGARRAVPMSQVERPKQARHAVPLRETPAAGPAFASLDAILTTILTRMQPGQEYSRADLVDSLGLTTVQWNAAIQELKRTGKVRQVGEKRGARYVLNNAIN